MQKRLFFIVLMAFFAISPIVAENVEYLTTQQFKETIFDYSIEKDGKDLCIGFNPKFFIDALRVIDEEVINLYMVNPKAPCFIKDDEGKFIYLILPVNFNNV